ncbi:MAG: hypothetical protein KJ052_03860, partial [Candidatus Hydrogenedentes bacterium]|nr:hypothetical protein [Candidatus Hydrogenedentota bacterium]
MPEFEVERRIEIDQLKRRIEDIRGTFYGQQQPIGGIEAVVTGPGKGPERMPAAGWKPFQVLGSWGGFDQTTWFRMTVTIPETMKGKRVVALIRVANGTFTPGVEALSAAGEALVYLNGKPVQGLDLNRDEVLLAAKAKGGETFDLAIEAVPSTRFDARHIFQFADLAVFHPEPWEFYWDATVALEVVETLDADSVQRRRLLQLVNHAVQRVDLQHIGEPAYFESLDKASRFLRKELRAFDDNFGMGRLVLAGHAHIDTAWLWPLRETRRKCGRTFSNVLGLMERYPEFHFSCSQPAQYEWIKTHYPELFERIKQRVQEGRWELFGGAWIEPDHNVPSGESLVRQYLYGNRWFEKEFGKRSHFAWVPDSFGYTWSLPQILTKCQIKAFLTTKITWSMFTEFPYSYFQWEGTDGTRIPALMPPLNYNGNPLPKNCIDQWKLFKEKKHVEELPFAFGWGDGGGGPTSAMIEHGRRLENMTGVPKCSFGRMSDSVSRMLEQSEASQLPVYNDELYLELHRACQITHARTKRNNRLCEKHLHDAEFLSSLALLNGGVYDDTALLDAWKIVLTNQFHDILPGSSITEVYTQADKDYAEAKTCIASVQDNALAYLLDQINTTGEGQPIVVFNSLSWVRSELVRVQLEPQPDHFSILDPNGNPVAYQQTGANEILFEAAGIPPLGYAAYRLVSGAQIAEATGLLKVTEKGMENPYIRLRFDKTGALSSVYDKVEARDVLSKGVRGNVLQLFDDRPFDHDAWDIDHNFEEKTWEPRFMGAEVIETGPLRGVVRLMWKTERSTFTQDVTMYAD